MTTCFCLNLWTCDMTVTWGIGPVPSLVQMEHASSEACIAVLKSQATQGFGKVGGLRYIRLFWAKMFIDFHDFLPNAIWVPIKKKHNESNAPIVIGTWMYIYMHNIYSYFCIYDTFKNIHTYIYIWYTHHTVNIYIYIYIYYSYMIHSYIGIEDAMTWTLQDSSLQVEPWMQSFFERSSKFG